MQQDLGKGVGVCRKPASSGSKGVDGEGTPGQHMPAFPMPLSSPRRFMDFPTFACGTKEKRTVTKSMASL